MSTGEARNKGKMVPWASDRIPNTEELAMAIITGYVRVSQMSARAPFVFAGSMGELSPKFREGWERRGRV